MELLHYFAEAKCNRKINKGVNIKMRTKEKISVLLIGMLMVFMTDNVFAAEKATSQGMVTNATISVTKELVLAEGTKEPTVTFNFTAAKITSDAPDATIEPISYGNTNVNEEPSNGTYKIFKTSQIQFGTFPHAGVYEYKVSENHGNADGVTYSTESYTLSVNVVNGENDSLYIKSISAKKDGTKQEKVQFTNQYIRRGKKLEIEKRTKGDLADKTKDFQFKILLQQPVTETAEQATYIGKIGEETVSITSGVETTFTLHDKEKLVFTDLPAGTRYKVTEVGVKDGYIPSVDVIENGVKQETKTGTDEDSISTGNVLVGEDTNSVVFINTYNEVPVTGLIMNNLPFLLLGGIAMLAFVMLPVMKRRKSKH